MEVASSLKKHINEFNNSEALKDASNNQKLLFASMLIVEKLKTREEDNLVEFLDDSTKAPKNSKYKWNIK